MDVNVERKVIAQVEQDMRRWLERAVIGLNLCPFAKSVYVKDQVHFVVSRAREAAELLQNLSSELKALSELDPQVRDTTLLMAPWMFRDFLEFNDFMDDADAVIGDLGLEGTMQLAHFHPGFRFAGTEADDVGNCTNRAPYPTLHLLRESSIDRAVQAFPEAESIYEANIATLERLGAGGWADLSVGPTVELPEGAGGDRA